MMRQDHVAKRWRLILLVAGCAVLLPGCLALGMAASHELSFDADARCVSANRIVDREGRLLHLVVDPNTGMHAPVPLDEMPDNLRWAVVATEDASFYSNPGIDLKGILRAAWLDVRAGRIVAGGSTITQQVARTLVLGRASVYDRTWQRKVQEMAVALRLNLSLTKDDILTLYLNESYFGNYAYGAQAAAQVIFGKPVAQLDLAECALLAGVLQAPSYHDPLTNPEAARQRQQIVLTLMARQGWITAEQADLAAREPLRFAPAPGDSVAPHACVWVEAALPDLVAPELLAEGGLTIETTLAYGLQTVAVDQVALQLGRLNQDVRQGDGVDNAAVVVLDARTGAIYAMVGSPDADDPRIDGAVNACLTPRQPGSALKPLTYALAFERGVSPATIIADVRTAYVTREGQPYVPVNYDYRYHGPVPLRQALACSYNIVAVKLLDDMGLEHWAQGAQRFGLTTLADPDRHGLALTLGSGEVSLMALSAAYSVLANGGQRVEPYLIERVLNAQGEVLYQHQAAPVTQVLDARVAYLVTDVLADDAARAPSFGRQSVLAQTFPAAVKTGTTTDWRDNWTVGYTPNLVVGVWVGNADNRPMRNISGVDGAAPIWHHVLAEGQRWLAPGATVAFEQPPGVISVQVCADSGLLPGDACTHRRRELFLAEHVPLSACDIHQWVDVDLRTGLLASADCAPTYRGQRRVTLWSPEVAPWASEHGLLTDLDRQVLAQAVTSSVDLDGQTDAGPSDGQPLRLRIQRPDEGSRYVMMPDLPRGDQQLVVEVAATPGLGPVTLWVDGAHHHTWQDAPYQVVWPLAPGNHVLVATQAGPLGDSVANSEAVSIVVYMSERIPAERGSARSSTVDERTGS